MNIGINEGKRNVRVPDNGRGAGITLSIPWLRKMGITEWAKEVVLTYDKKKIILEKK